MPKKRKELPEALSDFLWKVASDGLGYALSDYAPSEDELELIAKYDPRLSARIRTAVAAYNALRKDVEPIMAKHNIEM